MERSSIFLPSGEMPALPVRFYILQQKVVAASNIQVNAIAFGMIDTEMNAEFDEEDLALIKEEIPADYIASPKEAAQMVYHVATSPAYMTGQVITFSGGWY